MNAQRHLRIRVCVCPGVTRYIVNEVRDVYRLQGAKINDKHRSYCSSGCCKDDHRKRRCPDFRKANRLEYLRSLIANRAAGSEWQSGATLSRDPLRVSPKRSRQTQRLISAAARSVQ
ncbi:hypothetical protein KCP69_01245 [Salmonella enterica subsp. enterica]|nr:hypothetical protein KCP69_01245 [Salmonella enterica subsp. enterica]